MGTIRTALAVPFPAASSPGSAASAALRIPRTRGRPGWLRKRPRRAVAPPVLTALEWATIVMIATLRSPRVGMPSPAWRTRVRSWRSSAAWPECRSPGLRPSRCAQARLTPRPRVGTPLSAALRGGGCLARPGRRAARRRAEPSWAQVSCAPGADAPTGGAGPVGRRPRSGSAPRRRRPAGRARPVQDVGHIPDAPLPAGLRAIATRLLVNVVALGCVGTARIENPKERI